MSATGGTASGASTTSTKRTSSRTTSCRSSRTRSATCRSTSPTGDRVRQHRLARPVGAPDLRNGIRPARQPAAVAASSGFQNSAFITQLQNGEAGRLSQHAGRGGRQQLRLSLCDGRQHAARVRLAQLRRGGALPDQLLPGQSVRRRQRGAATRRGELRATTRSRSSSASATAPA